MHSSLMVPRRARLTLGRFRRKDSRERPCRSVSPSVCKSHIALSYYLLILNVFKSIQLIIDSIRQVALVFFKASMKTVCLSVGLSVF